VVAHTHRIGEPQYPRQLSQRRATAVATYIVQQGVEPRRITVQPRGERAPFADNASEAGRAQNRRVEMLIRPTAS
jgi:outer membrane protein OmpA-like peptidoglycan-associated protein